MADLCTCMLFFVADWLIMWCRGFQMVDDIDSVDMCESQCSYNMINGFLARGQHMVFFDKEITLMGSWELASLIYTRI